MNPVSSLSWLVRVSRTGFTARVVIVGALFFLDKTLLNAFVDHDAAQTAEGFGALVRDTQHWGFRFLVAWAAALAVFAYVSERSSIKASAAAVREAPLQLRWLVPHVLAIGCLVPLTYRLYGQAASLPFALMSALGLPLALLAAASAVLTVGPFVAWRGLARSLGDIWAYALLAALAGASTMQLTQKLWVPTSTLTFDLVRRVLLPLRPELSADASTRVLSTGRFAIEVADKCSGLEGMGLILAFVVAWLVFFRREYHFPRALVLIPLGLAIIFALNVLRLAALVLIGDAGYPEVAEYGFHSQAGWIAFVSVACGLALFSRRSNWFSRVDAKLATNPASANPTATFLMPLLAILAAGTLSHAMSGRFEVFYPLRLLAGGVTLFLYRRQLAAVDWRWSWRGVAVGSLIFAVWILCAHFIVPTAGIPTGLEELSPAQQVAWIASRVTASVITVPIAEELAYRGFLMRRLQEANFETLPYALVGSTGIAVSSIIFGIAHGSFWLPGIAAGLAYGVIAVKRGGLGEAMVAHATSNLLVSLTVLVWHQWQLW